MRNQMLNCEAVQKHITRLWPQRNACWPLVSRLMRIRDAAIMSEFVSDEDARFMFALTTKEHHGTRPETVRGRERMS